MNLKFKSTREGFPKNGESIFYIREKNHSLAYFSYEPAFTKVELQWFDGEGGSMTYDDSSTEAPEGYPYFLVIDRDGFEIYSDYFPEHWEEDQKISKHFWWMTEDEYFEQLENNRP